MNNMSRHQLLNYLNAVSLALDDVTLYLDTHPSDSDAIAYYNHLKEKRMQAISDYTKFYGPLCRYNVNCRNEWQWNKGPWPWQREA